jgi:hypothetical protein
MRFQRAARAAASLNMGGQRRRMMIRPVAILDLVECGSCGQLFHTGVVEVLLAEVQSASEADASGSRTRAAINRDGGGLAAHQIC